MRTTTFEDTIAAIEGALLMATKPENKSIRDYLRRKAVGILSDYIRDLDKKTDPNQIELPLKPQEHGTQKEEKKP